uniref:Uncharacterized protein n=2 Tax=Lutzomyia longipalpis TaxID=7200 RepID=A0A1B0GH45_LUTLO
MENFKHYLVNSSLHGLKYIGDTQLSLTERCFFIIAFIVVFLLSGYFISNVWQKWSETPIIIGLNPTAKSISTIPFPAITICNMNQADLHYAKSIANGTLDEALLGSMCGSERDFQSNNSSGKWRHFKKFLLSASQPCRDMLLMCRFASKLEPCMDIFWSSLTDDGLCCTFNTIHPDFMFQMASSGSKWENEEINSSKGEAIDWTPEKGYPENTPSRSFPRRSIGAGYNKGLTVILNCDLKNYYCSSTSSSGFKFLIHAPMETPKLANYGFFVPPGKETRVVVTPKVNEASDLIRRVSIQQRQCVFANEWNLSYFRTYTQKNCEMECESKTIAEQCGCIMYYMPKTEADIEICSLKDVECYENIKNAIKGNASFSCSCLPACHEIEYERRFSSGPLGVGKFLIKERFLNKFAPEFVRENIAVMPPTSLVAIVVGATVCRTTLEVLGGRPFVLGVVVDNVAALLAGLLLLLAMATTIGFMTVVLRYCVPGTKGKPCPFMDNGVVTT